MRQHTLAMALQRYRKMTLIINMLVGSIIILTNETIIEYHIKVSKTILKVGVSLHILQQRLLVCGQVV